MNPFGPPCAHDRPDQVRLFPSRRGRIYLPCLGLLLLLAGAAVGVVVAAYSQRPVYRSEGLIHIAYAVPPVFQGTDQNRPLPPGMFDSYMQSQKLLLTCRRVMDSAIQDPIWRTMGKSVPNEPDTYFASHLQVEVRPGSEFIRIADVDPDPGTAAAAVTSIMNSYAEFYMKCKSTSSNANRWA